MRFELTPQQKQNLQARQDFDHELLEGGAVFDTDNNSKPVLNPSEEQLKEMRFEMEEDLLDRRLLDRALESSGSDTQGAPPNQGERSMPEMELSNDELADLDAMSKAHITPERERMLLEKYKESGDPRVSDVILREYEWLAVYVVNKVMARLYIVYDPDVVASVDRDDLMQGARIGILKAIDGFDLKRSGRFSSYASSSAYGQAVREFNKVVGTLSIPSYRHAEVISSGRARYEGRPYPKERIAMIHRLLKPLGDSHYLPSDDVNDRLDGQGDVWLTPEDAISSDEELVEEIIKMDEMSNFLMQAIMDKLNPREREVIIERWGLLSPASEMKTLEQVGDMFGLSRERIRQIEIGAMRKLRPVLAVTLAAYVYSEKELYEREERERMYRVEEELREMAPRLELVEGQASRLEKDDLALEIVPTRYGDDMRIDISILSGHFTTSPYMCNEQGIRFGESFSKTHLILREKAKGWIIRMNRDDFPHCHLELR